MEHMIITIECFLGIKVSADDGAGRNIDGSMQVNLLIAKPEMNGSIHLNHLIEVGTARSSGVGIFSLDNSNINKRFFLLGLSFILQVT